MVSLVQLQCLLFHVLMATLRSDVTHLPLLEFNRLEMLALSPCDINFDLSVSQLEWQLWVEEVDRSLVTPFVSDARLVREAIYTQFYPALEQSRRRFTHDVEGPRLLLEERDKEAERQRLERLEVEHMLAVADERRRQHEIALLDHIARQAVWAQQQQDLPPLRYEPQYRDGQAGYYEDRADNGGWGRDFAPSGTRGERFGSTGSNASSGYGSTRASGTPYVPNLQIANALAPPRRSTASYAPDLAQRPQLTYISDPWLYKQPPAAPTWIDTRRRLLAA